MEGAKKMSWYALLEGYRADADYIKRFLPTAVLDEFDEHLALRVFVPDLNADENEIMAVATETSAAINAALRISVAAYDGFTVHGLEERVNNETKHRIIFGRGHSKMQYVMSGVGMVAHAGFLGKPVRTKEQRLVSLIDKRPDIADIANGLATRPVTWAVISSTYESVKGLVSAKSGIEERRGDWCCLVKLGWISKPDSNALYNTAAYYRHGYPKTSIRGGVAMPYAKAEGLAKELFWRVINVLEPE
jgi:hypothetical protein